MTNNTKERASSMIKIVFATGNPHKIEELTEITKSLGVKDIEFVLPPKGFDPIETGETFEENSLIKAQEANKLTKMISLADDSGLCTEALDDAPGIHSARYAETPQARIDKLLNALKNETNRNAKFVCVMTLLDENGEVLTQERGECLGEITKKQSGINGFGYDPVFLVKNTSQTMAEMSEKEKNQISHRGLALRKILKYLEKNTKKQQ
ncbi:MAG: RdgB/HAM1 family non-canonical purine NTP pyrophosphatase [Candidatus Gastranaerophilales bacterium]